MIHPSAVEHKIFAAETFLSKPIPVRSFSEGSFPTHTIAVMRFNPRALKATWMHWITASLA